METASDAGFHGHMFGMLVFLEIFSVGFVLAVFVFYFLLKRRIKKQKSEAALQKKPAEQFEN